MARERMATDFHVTVEGVGTFSFARRTMRDELRLSAEYSRITEGADPVPQWFDFIATAIAALKVLTVSAPDGWDVDQMDPLDDTTYDRITSVFRALREKEGSFRRGANGPSQGSGAPRGADAGVLVPQQVQPGADGSAVS